MSDYSLREQQLELEKAACAASWHFESSPGDVSKQEIQDCARGRLLSIAESAAAIGIPIDQIAADIYKIGHFVAQYKNPRDILGLLHKLDEIYGIAAEEGVVSTLKMSITDAHLAYPVDSAFREIDQYCAANHGELPFVEHAERVFRHKLLHVRPRRYARAGNQPPIKFIPMKNRRSYPQRIKRHRSE